MDKILTFNDFVKALQKSGFSMGGGNGEGDAFTICGSARKLSSRGEEYGWNSTMFCTVERFWDESVFDKAAKITRDEATQKITERIYELNPNADGKKIKKFIGV